MKYGYQASNTLENQMAKQPETKHQKIQHAMAREALTPAIDAARGAITEIKRGAAALLLRTAESIYLRANGWRPTRVDSLWTSPPSARKEHVNVDRSHAVNSQKKTGRGGADNDGAPPDVAPN